MPRDRSIRFSLVVLSLWTIAPAATAAAIGAAYAWRTGRSAAERELTFSAQALAADMARELAASQAALLILATSPSLAAGDFEAFRQQSLRVPKPDGARIMLTDLSGQMQSDSRAPPGAALPEPGGSGVSKVFATGRPQVSGFQAGPLTHGGLVAVEVPVELDGQVAYSLAMAFPPSLFAPILDNRRGLSEKGRIIVVDGNGLIVAHSSNVGNVAGRRIGAASLAAVHGGKSIFEGTSQDSFPILVAHAHVPGVGWSTLAAMRLDLDDAAMRRSIAGAAASGAVVLLLGLLAAEWYARRVAAPLHALVGTADALALGRLPRPIPPGVREASRIGAALAWTAKTLASQERERASDAAALQENETRFRTITDAMPQVVWSARPDGRHDYYNRRWYEYTGMEPGEGRKAWRVLFRSGDLSRAVAAWRRSLATGEPYQAEYRLQRADGTWRWCLTRASPLRDPATGAVRRWFGTCTDIQDMVEARETLARSGADLERLIAQRTAALIQAVDALHAEALERLQAEEALRQAQKMEAVGQLTGGIAHDFNNMLQGIASSIELVQRRAEQGRVAETHQYMERALKSVDRAAALTGRLLAFTRRQASQPVPVNPDALILGMEDLIRRAVRLSVEVELQAGGGAWMVLCDPNQLENALLNLAINAGDAMPGGGRLAVSTRQVRLDEADVAGHEGARPGDHTEIAVADTGTGMDEETRARAFEPFFTTKPVGRGTGLGLSQLLSFVRLTGGAVQIDSEPGRGTTVRLYLPRHEDMRPAVNLPPVPAC